MSIQVFEKKYGIAEAAIFEKYAEKLHWIKIAPDGVLEFYLDNHMMQVFRACEARFKHEFVEGYSGTGTYWFLEFGTVFHSLIETYYLNRHEPQFSVISWATDLAKAKWDEHNLDRFKDHPKYKELGGFTGFCALLMEYATYFNVQNERLRVIATEIYFGKNKEVPLLSDHETYSYAPFRAYLSGKMDLLIDDGSSICPMDHKTSSDFRGKNPLISYEIQDGMTGYVFAANEIVKSMAPSKSPKAVNKIIMNFAQVKPAKTPQDRFRRMPLYKTESQLEEYRMRMISTIASIYNLLATDREPTFNTFLCNNWMHQECSFMPVHRMPDKASQQKALNSLFQIKSVWNPENPDRKENKEGALNGVFVE